MITRKERMKRGVERRSGRQVDSGDEIKAEWERKIERLKLFLCDFLALRLCQVSTLGNEWIFVIIFHAE